MGRTGECAAIRPELGVYVTGAIGPSDRAALVRHLASCERCRDELVGLAALPGLLRRLPARAAAQPCGDSAVAPERDADEALLGRVLSWMAARDAATGGRWPRPFWRPQQPLAGRCARARPCPARPRPGPPCRPRGSAG